MKNLKNDLIKLNDTNRLYEIPVPIIGLTGGIGTGKTTVADLFRKKGIAVIDADRNVKNIYEMPETHLFIKTHFPQSIYEGKIVFKKLREIVFANPDSKKILEDFIYTHLPREFKSAFYAFDKPTFVVYDVPLLFEKQLHLLVDLSICVYAPRSKQIERIIKRDQTTKEIAENILANQMDIEVKKKLSDFVITNDSDLDSLEGQVDQLFKLLFQD